MDNDIHCETTENVLGYRYIVNIYEPVWTNSMCNEIGRLTQGQKKKSVTDTVEFILHK